MKRFLAFLSAVLLLFALLSCGAKEPEPSSEAESEPPDTTAEGSATSDMTTEEENENKKRAFFKSEENVIDIYLVAGQSNAVGYTNIVDASAAYAFAPELQNGFSNVLLSGKLRWNTGSTYASKEYTWIKTKLGLGMGNGGKMGPEAGMAKALAEVYNEQSGKTAGIIKYGHGGTSILTKVTDSTPSGSKRATWASPSYAVKKLGFASTAEYEASMTGELYREFLTVIEERLTALGARGYTNVNIKGLYWMQGENDRDQPEEYKTAFKWFAIDLRRDLARIVRTLTGGDDRGAADMPIFVGTISQTQSLEYPSAESVNLAFIAMQKTLPDIVKNVYVVDNSQYAISRYDENTGKANADGLGSDQWHWNQADQLEIGYNVGKAFLDLDGE